MLRNKLRQFAKATTIAFSVAALSAFVLAPSKTANAGGTLRIGMTAADIPTSFGQPDNGFEGFRFMGLMLYDGLINWDLTAVDGPSGVGGVDDYPTGKARLAYERHLAARKRLDAECDQADRELEESLGVLLTAASGLVEDVDGAEDHSPDDEGFNLLVGGGAGQAAKSNDSGTTGTNEAAPAA